jgi:hypothetical protein
MIYGEYEGRKYDDLHRLAQDNLGDEQVVRIRLDELPFNTSQQINYLKVDTEGGDLNVLRGAAGLSNGPKIAYACPGRTWCLRHPISSTLTVRLWSRPYRPERESRAERPRTTQVTDSIIWRPFPIPSASPSAEALALQCPVAPGIGARLCAAR